MYIFISIDLFAFQTNRLT